MHKINPNKLRHSKWTATQPSNNEKHFIVTQLLRDEEENVVEVVIEAIYSPRERVVPWKNLKNDSVWKAGWQ